MHEIALVRNLISILEKEVANSEVGEVKAIHLEVGELQYIAPEVMDTCFSNIKKHEKLRKAKIKVKVVPADLRCSDCGKKSVVRGREFNCDACSSRNVDIVAGNEFALKSIEW